MCKKIFSYNGPASQIVDYQFRIRKFETFLCVNFGIIIATMDGRGTDSNGDRFMKVVYRKLGELETQDQISLAKYAKISAFDNLFYYLIIFCLI